MIVRTPWSSRYSRARRASSALPWLRAMQVTECRRARRSIRFSVRRRLPDVAGYDRSPSTITAFMNDPASALVQSLVASYHSAHLEVLLDAAPPRLAQALTPLGIEQQRQHSGGQRLRVGRSDEQPGFTIGDHLGDRKS